jgi:adenosylcobyric acid synthase
MARTILVAGTASHVGKSTVAAGLCRVLDDRGLDVAPFKAQNMSNNARVVPRLDDDGPAWGEIGVSQYAQARAARTPAHTDHNPVLLKPRGDGESQLVLGGQAIEHVAAGEYYDDGWDRARETARAAHERLARTHDVVVAEGAGGVGEINLHHRDLANVETARFASEAGTCDVVLVADIERGGAFASLVGSLELMPAVLRERTVGAVITKFRGDRSILADGLDAFEQRTGVPVLGVLPYEDPGLPEEDSVALPATDAAAVRGGDDGVPDARSVTVAVPRLPRISNATDLEPLAAEPGVRVAYVPLDADLDDADAVVIPGTKNTVDDLVALREAGLQERLRAFAGPIVGLCGGYQLLGREITNGAVESTGERESIEGVGLLPVRTRFSREKTVRQVEHTLEGVGPLAGATGTVSGYEIHAGETTVIGDVARPFAGTGAATEQVLGTYLHGLFENRVARDAFVASVYASAGRSVPESGCREKTDPYERAGRLLRDHLDLSAIGLE